MLNYIDNQMKIINNELINFLNKTHPKHIGIFVNDYSNIHTGIFLSALYKSYYYVHKKKTKISVPGYLKYTNINLMNKLKQKFKYKIIINHIITNEPKYSLNYHSDKKNFYIDITLKTNSYQKVDSDALLFAFQFLSTYKFHNKIFIHPLSYSY